MGTLYTVRGGVVVHLAPTLCRISRSSPPPALKIDKLDVGVGCCFKGGKDKKERDNLKDWGCWDLVNEEHVFVRRVQAIFLCHWQK